MPSLHRPAASSLVTGRPSNEIAPASGGRPPEMRPNRLVLPAPFGPTIPTVSPAPTASDSWSAMTTWPNRFVTWSSWRSGLVIGSLVGRLEVAGDLRLRLQCVVDHYGLERVLGALLPLNAHRRGDGPAPRGRLARGEVDRPGHAVDVHLVDRVGHLVLVVRVVDRGERGVRDLEQGVVADVGVPLPVPAGLVLVGQLLAGLAGEGRGPRQRGGPPGVGGD